MTLLKETLAQLTVPGLLVLFLTLMTMSALMPTIQNETDNMSINLTAGGYTVEATLADMIPLFIIVTFLATIVLYAAPRMKA